ncbi:hypothetical protein GCM10010206_17120 [Streptomyces cinerochromogenes]|nr:hypothetical protein GCM10010206_17120 [Streptomyces cinerochromogenes]
MSCRHVPESSQPDEAVRVVEVPELAEHEHPGLFLGFDELLVEQLDEFVASSWSQRVLAEFDHCGAADRVGRGHGRLLFGFFGRGFRLVRSEPRVD